MITNPLVVGYKGEIGSFILQGLLKVMPKALNIWCVDINESESEVIDRINKSDIIFLCVPFNETLSWLNKYQVVLQRRIVVEQCSLKEHLFKQAPKGIILKSMHILFRPSTTPNLNDRQVILTDGPNGIDADECQFIADMTESKIVFLDGPKEHDEQMALQQALIHRTIVALGSMIEDRGCSTYIGKRLIELKDRICKGDRSLYEFIQSNPNLQEHIDVLEDKINNFNIRKY